MRIAISGTNGYIGQNMIRELKNLAHQIVPISRTALYDPIALSGIITDTDVVIHLAGSPILCRWTTTNKETIRKSRTETTRNIIQSINTLLPEHRPHLFISASAIGIYSPNKRHTEASTSFENDFVGEVVKHWEQASDDLTSTVRKVIFRIGPVVGKEAQTMKQLLPIFKLGLGGKIGSGKQAFPFVHITDVVKSFLWAIHHSELDGVYNLIAPQNITNEQFTKAMAKAVNRPAFFTVPAFVLRIIYSEAASILLHAPEVYPERLLKSGYKFKYPDIQSALAEIIS